MLARQRAIFPDTAENALKEEFFGGARTGYFVDVGANDPKDMSQTWHLERLGWRGVLVEPQPTLAQRLREQRQAQVFACACSSPANAGKMLRLHAAGIHSSLNPDFFVAGMRKEDVIEVPARTLDDILEEAKAPVPIDLLSIDVENHEIEVLSGLTLPRWQPRLILIEDLGLDLKLHRLLTSRGYKWVRRTGLNGWYVPANSPMTVSPFGQWQFLRKHYLGVPFRHLREAKRKQREKLRAALGRSRRQLFWSSAVVAERISVIVATYNRPDALDAVLRSLERQSDPDFEVLVADDGSTQPTKDLIGAWQMRFDGRLHHVWHPDDGFRLAEIRNRAILAASGGYCIFLDGDCIARTNFVAAHRTLAKHGWFVTGNRLLLSRALSERILKEKLEPESWSFADWWRARRAKEIKRLAPLVALPLGPLRQLRRRDWRGAQGCNLGIWRSDLIAVDGFEGGFASWGREDSDLLVRLMRAGVRRRDGRMATGVLHLWHAEADRSRLPDNERRLDAVLASQRIRAERGLSALSQ